MPPGTNWSSEEDNMLIMHYKSSTAKELASKLGRTEKAIQRRAFRLGLANKTPKVTIESVKREFEDIGYTLTSTSYKNSTTPLQFVCSRGHSSRLSWNKFKNGRRCPRCYYDRGDMYERISASFKCAGYKLLLKKEDYLDSKQKLPFICNNGHHYEIDWNCFGQGQRCSKCNSTTSGAEKEIVQFIKSLDIDLVENDREFLDGLELDIYIPHKNIAIEYCGLRWHGELFSGKERNYHYNKYKRCLEKNTRLITIFEDEYLERPEVVFSRIRAALGKIGDVIYARDTCFGEVDYTQAKDFLEQSHLQGYSPSKYKFGLFLQGELVQVMTFGAVSRKHAAVPGMLELKRLAARPGTIVVGGAQKLLKNSLPFFDSCSVIKSYCDMRWANPFSSVYDKLGFRLNGCTKYTPHYTKKQKRYRNHTLRRTADERGTGISEWELRKSQGYDRIWDCGHRTYTFEINGGF